MSLTRSGSEWIINSNELRFGTTLTSGNTLFLGIRSGFNGSNDLVGQIVSPAGVALGASFVLKSYTSGEIFDLAVTSLTNGRFAVALQRVVRGPDSTSTSDDIVTLETGIFNSDGSVFKASIQVGSGSVNVRNPTLTALADGGYAMSYDDGGTKSIAFDRSGVAGAVSSISPAHTNVLAGLRGGGYVTVTTGPAASGSGTEIKAYLRQTNGSIMETLIKTTSARFPEAQVVGLADGNFVVAWREENTDGSVAVKARVISPQGAPVGSEVTLHSVAAGNLSGIKLGALLDGGFALVLDTSDANDSNVCVATYSATGAIVTAPTLAHPNAEGYQSIGDLGILKDGRLLVSWQGGGYHFQVFDTGYVVPPGTDPSTTSGFIRIGTKGKDALVGGWGDDKFYGDYGNDKLTGGAGADVFVFNAKLGTAKTDRKVNFDTITDFKPGEDKIWLDNAIFKKLGKAGTETTPAALNKKLFKIGKQAGDKNDYVIYDKKTGILSYDADGSGAKEPIEIAKLAKNLKLSHLDFAIV